MLYHIYKITIGNKIYIGSTTNPQRRWIQHMNHAKESSKKHHYQIYVEMRLIGVDICVFEVLYEIECADKTEARKAEQLEIDKYPKEVLINTRYAYRTKNEYQKEYRKTDKSKDYRKEYMKEYDKTDQRKEYKKEYQIVYRKEHAKTDQRIEYLKEYIQRPEVKERRNRQARERRAKKKLELEPVSIVSDNTSANVISTSNGTQ